MTGTTHLFPSLIVNSYIYGKFSRRDAATLRSRAEDQRRREASALQILGRFSDILHPVFFKSADGQRSYSLP